jgi:hypothetical protein
MLNARLLGVGLAVWLIGSVLVRLAGEYILRPDLPLVTFVLYVASFILMALLARRLCRAAGLPRELWPIGAISLALPSLVLDGFSSWFFPAVYPNVTPDAAGIFGGWILLCCAGAVAGATVSALPAQPDR